MPCISHKKQHQDHKAKITHCTLHLFHTRPSNTDFGQKDVSVQSPTWKQEPRWELTHMMVRDQPSVKPRWPRPQSCRFLSEVLNLNPKFSNLKTMKKEMTHMDLGVLIEIMTLLKGQISSSNRSWTTLVQCCDVHNRLQFNWKKINMSWENKRGQSNTKKFHWRHYPGTN